MSEPFAIIGRDGPAEYALGFAAVEGGVRLDIAVDGLELSLVMKSADAKIACESLLAAYGTAFDRRPHGVAITRKKED